MRPGAQTGSPSFLLIVQASAACFVRKVEPKQRRFEPWQLHGKTRRHLPPADRSPAQWSADESMYRTGGCSMAAMPYASNEWGGFWRALPLFAADAKRTCKGQGNCTKHKYSHGALSPGLMVRCHDRKMHLCGRFNPVAARPPSRWVSACIVPDESSSVRGLHNSR